VVDAPHVCRPTGDDLLARYQLAYALFFPGFQHQLLAARFA